jgi:hypothetical protein
LPGTTAVVITLCLPCTRTELWGPLNQVVLQTTIPREPASGLEPLHCSLRVIGHVLQGFARDCKSRISRRLSLLRLAECCTVLRSRWYQSGINVILVSPRQGCPHLAPFGPYRASGFAPKFNPAPELRAVARRRKTRRSYREYTPRLPR